MINDGLIRLVFYFQGRLTASSVGQIVGLQSDEIKQIVSEYAEKVWHCLGGFSKSNHSNCSY